MKDPMGADACKIDRRSLTRRSFAGPDCPTGKANVVCVCFEMMSLIQNMHLPSHF